MASEELNTPRSRRALLAAAAGAAGAFAAQAALPLTAAAAPVNMQTEFDNQTTALTSVTQSTDAVVAFKAKTGLTGAAGLVGSTGDESNIATNTSFTGAYGWAPTAASSTFFATGLWGDSDDVGTYGSGYVGVRGDGFVGVYGRGDAAGAGVVGQGGAGGFGVIASGATATDVGLAVTGKVQFSRSGRSTIRAGRANIRVNLAGVSSGSRVFAVLHSNRSGRYVRAVVPTTGYFVIYLNGTVTANTYVAWFVIN
jgi:hypothetical protein